MVKSGNLAGALLMMASVAGFTLNDAVMKLMSQDIPFLQLLFLRSALVTVIVVVMAWRMGALGHVVARRDGVLMAVRAGADVVAAFLYFTALFHMPLANVTAIMQSLPLVIALAAALAFREPLGWRRLSAIAVGFAGVMLIVRPGAEGFSLWSVYALGAVAFVTIRDLATRRLGREVPSILVNVVSAVVLTVVFGLASTREVWVAFAPRDVALLGAAGAFVLVGYLCSVIALRTGDLAVVIPFRYTAILWALGLGWVVFGDWPRPLTFVGVGIVVAAGLFTIYREARLGRRIAMSRPPHPQ